MEKELVNALENVINAMQKNNKLYDLCKRNDIRDEDKFTVLGLRDLAHNHLFEKYTDKLGINQNQGNLIETYFKSSTKEKTINDLYQIFPNVFQGESAKHVNSYELNKNIPLF